VFRSRARKSSPQIKPDLTRQKQLATGATSQRRKEVKISNLPLSPQKPRVAEFFAGIGLVRLAAEKQGFEVVFANDIDPKKEQIYADNFGKSDFQLGDIHALTANDIPAADLYTASFPCNDLSVAGAQAGLAGEHSGAFWGLIDLLKEKSLSGDAPRLVLLENVPGFLTSRGGADLRTALTALNDLGYGVDLVRVDAVHFTPQSRARVFVIAEQKAAAPVPFALETSDIRPVPLVRFIQANADLQWSIRAWPKLPKMSATIEDIIEDPAEEDALWWNQERTTYFLEQLSAKHEKLAGELIASKHFRYATAFRRVRKGRSMAELRADGVAGCLRTPRGGSGRQILFRGGKGTARVRLLSARECARLQGAPDDFRLNVPLNQALFGFGDAVCVPVVEWVIEHGIWPRLRGELCQKRSLHLPLWLEPQS
jgi:DNA (cytosine-5)-methyltransferase 1